MKYILQIWVVWIRFLTLIYFTEISPIIIIDKLSSIDNLKFPIGDIITNWEFVLLVVPYSKVSKIMTVGTHYLVAFFLSQLFSLLSSKSNNFQAKILLLKLFY